MSLHALAEHMQAKGRNNDSMLVHMTPGEVGGLQELAMAHGGSLTINPETGLPEAGFLSKLLPMIAGFALAPLTAGTSLAFLGATPLASALTVGAATGLAKGSLKEGLMAGLGAYGGAGLSAGLTQTGASVMPSATTSATTSAVPNTMIEGSKGLADKLAQAGQSTGTFAGPGLNPSLASSGSPSAFSTIGQGAKAGFGNGMDGLKALYGNIPDGTLPALGAYAMMGMNDDKGVPPLPNQGMIRPYTLNRQQNQSAYDTQIGSNGQRMPVNAYGTPMDSSERNFFTDTYTAGKPYKAPGPEYAADGGIVGLAVGGRPEQQAAVQAVGMNTNYPMSQLQTPMYSDPSSQRPMAREVVNPSGDAGVDPFTGEARYAEGGDVSGSGYLNLNVPINFGGMGMDGANTTSGYAAAGGVEEPALTANPNTPANPNTSANPNTALLQKAQQATGLLNSFRGTFADGGMVNLAGGGMTAFASGGKAFPNAPAPTVDYTYNPKNMEYTQTTTTPPPAQRGPFGFFGGLNGLGGSVGNGPASYFMNPMMRMAAMRNQQAPQPTVTTQTIGGMIDPYMPPQQQTQIGAESPKSDIAQYAVGGIADLGGYSDGGRLLRGPGDGVSDSIPASIGNRQPARLADGEFVVPARIVSEIGNGSTEAGARKLYAMMDRVQNARRKTVGKKQVAKNTKAERLLPA